MSVRVLEGDCLAVLPTLEAGSVQTCVTSPPYWGLRDYGAEGQIGLERDPREFIAKLVAVFAEVRRALRPDGTLWLNMGDSYTDGGRGDDTGSTLRGSRHNQRESRGSRVRENARPFGLGKKQLVGIPWRLALALQDDGWVLRSDIVWHKPNPMPESVTDRPTKAHEYVFLLSKNERYFYDADAIAEPVTDSTVERATQPTRHLQTGSRRANGGTRSDRPMSQVGGVDTRNARTVWTLATQPYSGAHFATMPPALAERCILAGSKIGDTVLDPFGGAGTTGLVADRLTRHALLVELNPTYAALARERITNDNPLFGDVA